MSAAYSAGAKLAGFSHEVFLVAVFLRVEGGRLEVTVRNEVKEK